MSVRLIVTYAMLCVSFLSKSKATNVSSKHIPKLKAHDQSIQARKKLFRLVQQFVEVFDQNRKYMEA